MTVHALNKIFLVQNLKLKYSVDRLNFLSVACRLIKSATRRVDISRVTSTHLRKLNIVDVLKYTYEKDMMNPKIFFNFFISSLGAQLKL